MCAPALRSSAAATSGLRGLHAMALVFIAIHVCVSGLEESFGK
jgi:hypothetical protein